MRLEAAATSAGVIGGMATGLGVQNIEMAAYMLSIITSAIILVAGTGIYLSREWQLKIAITPLYIGAVVYLIYTYSLNPSDTADYFCQVVDSIGIAALVLYVIWNRRKKHALWKREEKKGASEKTHPSQMRVVTGGKWPDF